MGGGGGAARRRGARRDLAVDLRFAGFGLDWGGARPDKEHPVRVNGSRFLGLVAASVALMGCSSGQKQARDVAPTVTREVPAALRGTIASQATLQRAQPVLVSGYGLVVGLNGTGGGDIEPRVAQTMERMLGLNGVGKNSDALVGTPLEGMTPREVLRSRDVAVVVVYAAVIPGAPVGAQFDCFVSAVNRAPEVSLEGGMLWTSDLQMGPASTFGTAKTRVIARAHGPVFINPFSEPGKHDGMARADGRVLSGGIVVNPLPLELVLDNESHTKARAIAEAINNRFPERSGEGPTARGRTARIIDIVVPAAYRERGQEFLNLLVHVQTDPSLPQEYAHRYVETLKQQPALADELCWCLQALPQRAAVSFIRELYDSPELAPKMAALRAGAALDDPLAQPALKQLAISGPTTVRTEAIGLLGKLSAGPTVDQTLREFLASDDFGVRVAAYEALSSRAEKDVMRRRAAQQANYSSTTRVAWPRMGAGQSPLEISGENIQGVRRRVIEGKFILDMVPGGKPLIYVSQQGRPRIVLFGDHVDLSRPALVSAWSGSRQEAAAGPGVPSLARLVLTADTPSDSPRLMYRYPNRFDEEGRAIPGRAVTSKVSHRIPEFIEYLAHTPTPEDTRPGLGMSYSEVVGALYAIQRGGGTDSEFAVEEDWLRLRLLQAADQTEIEERPESKADAERVKVYKPVPGVKPQEAPKPVEKPDLTVPLERPAKAGGQ